MRLDPEPTRAWQANDDEQTGMGSALAFDFCPECEELIVLLRRGLFVDTDKTRYLDEDEIESEKVIYPSYTTRELATEVPKQFRKDFLEACSVLSLSPKASAALSRRVLQTVLREVFNVKSGNLASEIDQFLQLKDVPAYLTEAIDAIRHIGNFAAHPLKDTHTGEIVEVETGEAEWLLDVLESLFDFAFVQPMRLEKKKKNLNQKLAASGKPPMKG